VALNNYLSEYKDREIPVQNDFLLIFHENNFQNKISFKSQWKGNFHKCLRGPMENSIFSKEKFPSMEDFMEFSIKNVLHTQISHTFLAGTYGKCLWRPP